MAGRKKTTFAKLEREAKQRDRRIAKQARKDARKLASAHETERAEDELHAEAASTPGSGDTEPS